MTEETINNIRNFVIVAHIDHGKSTLADRFLEITGTVPARSMKPQYLDQMDLERERGITIKMTPVRMVYKPYAQEFVLNLIDTPGHNDFAYEVSRALTAVEGAVLLVDATQGIQAQTLANFNFAKKAGLTIIGAVNKIDLNPPDLEIAVKDLALLIGTTPDKIHRVSGKTGYGVRGLLDDIVANIPPPKDADSRGLRADTRGKSALVFDSLYDDHKGVIAFTRVFSGTFVTYEETKLVTANEKFKIKELGFFSPKLTSAKELGAGEIGYIATGLKDPNKLKIGDTIGDAALTGYKEPKPVVFVSLYPTEEADYEDLKSALNRLKLNDSSFTFEPDASEVLGRGFKCGFLGRLHYEIVTQRLVREFNIETVSSFPSVAYRITLRGKTTAGSESARREPVEPAEKEIVIKTPQELPHEYTQIFQPMVQIEILTPPDYLGDILSLQKQFRFSNVDTQNFGDHLLVSTRMPLSELISNFDDKLKSASRGYASFSYEMAGEEKAELKKLEILVAGDAVPGLTRLVFKDEAEREGRSLRAKPKA